MHDDGEPSGERDPGNLAYRLRFRGPNGAKDGFLLAATAQNLRKMAKLLPGGTPAMAN